MPGWKLNVYSVCGRNDLDFCVGGCFSLGLVSGVLNCLGFGMGIEIDLSSMLGSSLTFFEGGS